MIDITEILVHWYAGRSQYEIAQSLAVDRKTIRKYLAPAIAEGLTPGGPPIGEAEWAAKVRRWFPQMSSLRLRQVTWKYIEPHHEFITQQLQAGVTVSTIHQRLRDEHDLAVSPAVVAPVCAGEHRGRDRRRAGAGAQPAGARARGAGADRLGPAGAVDRSGDRQAAHGAGVCDGAVLLAAHVRAAGDLDVADRVDPLPCGGV
ncbi:hypothetical protein [Sphaerisporangium album]|uniref:hypothetical protein n=1 Tax=Sphaerisporangium album TaxID=509200 RepID=UPI0011C057D8|nr:hypothetical protein [Sphaerisporangium album]